MKTKLLEVNKIREKLYAAFEGMEFDEAKHRYTLDGEVLPSVSSLISNFYDPFDSEAESVKYAEKYGFDVEDVKASWFGENQISVEKGHAVHQFAEDYTNCHYFGADWRPLPHSKQCLGVIQFWNSLPEHIVPLALELRMFSRKYMYAGTADVLLYDTKSGCAILADYKTNKELKSSFPQGPMKFIDQKHGLVQDNFGKYSLQLGGFYRVLLEEAGFKVSHHCIIWLQQEGKQLYQKFWTKNLTADIRKYLENRG